MVGVTLAVFARESEGGPVSVVEKYHLALLRGDKAAIQACVLEPLNSPNVAWLSASLQSRLRRNPNYVIVKVAPAGRHTYVDVLYDAIPPSIPPDNIAWIVVRTPEGQRISLGLTFGFAAQIN